MSSLKDNLEKIKILETEKKSLLAEIEELKKMVEAKAVALETEVGVLRNEVKSLKSLMGPEQIAQNKKQI